MSGGRRERMARYLFGAHRRALGESPEAVRRAWNDLTPEEREAWRRTALASWLLQFDPRTETMARQGGALAAEVVEAALRVSALPTHENTARLADATDRLRAFALSSRED